MAGLEVRDGRYNLILRFGGRRFIRSLKTSNEDEALAKKLRVEENIRLVEAGRLEIPDDADVVTFLLSDGKLAKKPEATSTLTLAQVCKQFFDDLPEGSLEASTIATMKIHQGHLERGLGKRFNIQGLAHDDLQKYVTKRSRHKTSRGTINGDTIKKEVVTLRTIWKWAVGAKLIQGDFPNEKLRYPKSDEAPPFQTWAEIERQIAHGGSPQLWESLYLTMDEIGELLDHVKEAATFPFIHPMFATAAYTGARRSELMRSELADIDFTHKVITLRERKRVKAKRSTRRVPISAPLKKILQPWIKSHPGGPYTFCHLGPMPRSGKQDRTGPLTPNQADHHFEQPLANSDWEVIKGWHCLRHSFISNCASRGIDQRMIDEWVGHQTDDMRRRYRHLFPSTQQDAMQKLFG